MNAAPIIRLPPAVPPADDDALSRAVREVASACGSGGFFQVVDHGVPEELIDRVWRQTHDFFALPRPEKLKLLRSRHNPRGYYDRELTKNTRDLKEVFDFGFVPYPELSDHDPANRDRVNGYNRWPDGLPGFKTTMREYFAACEALAMRLLRLFCLGLDSPADVMRSHFAPRHTSFVRLNYYPLTDPLTASESSQVAALGNLALHHHSDSGAFTILLQDDAGGLQVYSEGEWRDVEPLAGAFVVNTADMMQVWSNDRYQAPLHRVTPVKDRPRYSIPFFFNPCYDADCAPLEALTRRDAPRYRPINWGEFRRLRTDGDYADYGKEVQLEDYRIR